MTHGIVEIPSELSGGRNLFLNGSDFTNVNGWSGNIGEKDGFKVLYSTGTAYPHSTDRELEPDTEYVLTATFMIGTSFALVPTTPVHLYTRYLGDSAQSALESGYTLVGDIPASPLAINKWHTVSLKFKTKADPTKKPYLKFHLYMSSTASDKWLRNVKLEKGSTPTTHQQAPEDLGYELPQWIQNFDSPSLMTPNGIAGKNIVEIPNELVGGRNLIQNSSKEVNGGREYVHIPITDVAKKYLGKDITVSIDVKLAVAGAFSIYTLGRYQIGRSGSIQGTTEYKRYTFKTRFNYGVNPDPNGEVCHLSVYGTYDTGRIPTIKNVKVEIGHNETPYQVSPEDLGYQLPNWVQNFDAPISVCPEGIAVKELVEAPDELIASRNLIKNNEVINFSGTDTSTLTNRSHNAGLNRIEQKLAGSWNAYYFAQHLFTDPDFFKNIGQIYTLSADIRTSMRGGQVTFRFDTRSPNTAIYSSSNPVTNTNGEWVRTSTTMIIPDRAIQNQSLLILNGSGMSVGDYVEIKNIKLEKGDTATPYEKAPEDLGYQIPLWAKNFNNPISISPNGVMVSGR